MMGIGNDFFRIVEHRVPAQHIREYPNGTRYQAIETLHLAVKQYIPANPTRGPSDSVTLLAAHGNGFPKECYEPFFEQTVRLCHDKGIGIRSIWIADSVNQGQSGILNENLLGDDPAMMDHARDLLLLVNLFREEFKPPVLGIGHSMGCVQLINLALIHPRLLSGLIMVEPMAITRTGPPPFHPAGLVLKRPDLWPSREEAAKAIRKSGYYKAWNPRVLDLYIKYGLRTLPTPLYPTNPFKDASNTEEAVTFTTTKHQEAWNMGRLNLEPQEGSDMATDRILNPVVDEEDMGMISTAPEMFTTFDRLPHVRPDLHWIFAEKSPYNMPHKREEKMKFTGIGLGGNGGVKYGNVTQVVLPKASHFIPFDSVQLCSEATADKISLALDMFKAREAVLKSHKSKKADDMMIRSSKLAEQVLRMPYTTLRSGIPKTKSSL